MSASTLRATLVVVSFAGAAGCGKDGDPSSRVDAASGATEPDGAPPSTGGKGSPGAGGSHANGSGGGATSSGGEPATGADAGSVCLPALAKCGPSDTCCGNAVCAADAAGTLRCRQTCSVRGDCGSLCCLDDAATGRKLCADEALCPAIECSKVGKSCTGPGEACCAGTVCLAWDDPPRSECRPACTTGTDCSSGCCLPLAGSSSSYCETADACQCAARDATCGGVRHCCAGTACTTFDATGAFACKPTCTAATDCASGCCRPVGNTGESVCLDASWCK